MLRLLLSALTLVGSVLWTAFLTDAAWADRRVALVIGNSQYKNSTLALFNPKNDAEDVAAALRLLSFEVIQATDATKRDLELALQRFARAATDADSALFFYAGHAIQLQGRNYLMPVDAEIDDEVSVRYQMVAIDDVRSALDRANGVKIMILDACRNNPLSDRLASKTRSVGSTRGLARIDKTQGMVVAYATAADDVAMDGTGRNSPFTASLLKRMQEPGLEIEMMFRRIAADVNARTNGKQRPETYISLLSEYYLNPIPLDRLAWDRIKGTDSPAELRDFLYRYPTSTFAPQAKNRADMLESFAREREVARLREEWDRQRQERETEERRLTAERQRVQQDAAERQRVAKEAEEQRVAEERRVAAERREAEERARLAEAERQRVADAERQWAEAKRLADQQRVAEEKRVAEQKRLEAEAAERVRLAEAEKQKQARDAEQRRLAAEKRETEERARLAEAKRLADENRIAEQKRLEAEAAERTQLADAEKQKQTRTAEERRLAAEKREAEERTRLAELERQRQGETQRLAEAARAKQDEAEQQRLAKDAEKARIAAEKRDAEERAKVAEAERVRLAKEAREAQRLAKLEQERQAREAREAEQRRVAEQKKLEVEQKKAEQEAAERARVVAEQRRREQEIAERREAEERGRLAKIEQDRLAAEKREQETQARLAEAERQRLAREERRPTAAEQEAIQAVVVASLGDQKMPAPEAPQANVTPKVAVEPEINSARLVTAAQTELRRLGCFAGKVDGKFGDNLRKAITRYRAEREIDAAETKVTDDFIAELKDIDERICPLTCGRGEIAKGDRCIAAPKPEKPKSIARRSEPEVTPRRPVRAERPAPARPVRVAAPPPRQSNGGGGSSGGGGGGAKMLGVGF